MNIQEYQSAVATINGDCRGVGITTSQVPLGSNALGLAVQMQTGEEFIFRSYEEFTRWWNQLLQGPMTMQRVKAFLEERGRTAK